MKLQILKTRKIYTVKFPTGVSHTKIAKKLGINPQRVWAWITRGKVPEEYLVLLKKMNVLEVLKEK